jgi:carbon monoxide dehydrogenase subunit G
MKLEQSFTVAAPVEEVWDTLVDVERVAPCLPGAEVTGQGPDGSYEGTFTVKLGPTTASYRGSLKMDSLDEASRTATMHANGTDKRGQGGAHAVIVSTLRQEGEETVVDVVTDFNITGRLARFGRGGMIEDISKRMMRDFSQCLQASIASGPASAPVASEAPPAAAPAAAAPAAAAPAAAAPAAEAPAAEAPAAEAPAAEAPVTPGEEADAAVASAGGAAAEASAASSAPAAQEPPAPPRPQPQAAKPVHGIRLVLSVLWERVKRFFARLVGRGEK